MINRCILFVLKGSYLFALWIMNLNTFKKNLGDEQKKILISRKKIGKFISNSSLLFVQLTPLLNLRHVLLASNNTCIIHNGKTMVFNVTDFSWGNKTLFFTLVQLCIDFFLVWYSLCFETDMKQTALCSKAVWCICWVPWRFFYYTFLIRVL